MKDERYWPVLATWLKDTAAAPPDPRKTARDVAELLPRTPQVGRYRWLPSRLRTSDLAHGNDQATGHLPAATGRTRLMFSPVKAIIGGALIFAIGGAFLIARPMDQHQVATPGAEAAYPTGTRVAVAQDCDREVDPPACAWTSSDARLTGAFTEEPVGSIVSVSGLDGDFEWAEVTLDGPEGAWTGHLYIAFTDPSWGFVVLSGSGDYEGWQYVATGTGGDGRHDDWSGIIYEGELPPFGPLPSAASE